MKNTRQVVIFRTEQIVEFDMACDASSRPNSLILPGRKLQAVRSLAHLLDWQDQASPGW